MNVLVTGATGFVGKEVCLKLLEAGHRVTAVSRNVEKAKGRLPFPLSFFAWKSFKEGPPAEAFTSIDAVIHLAGESIAENRWTAEQKQLILDSRVESTHSLLAAIAQLKHPPKIFVCASAVGWYGDRGDEVLTEASPAGSGFLSEVCQAWEAAAEGQPTLSLRRCRLRTGMVLGRGGGALKALWPLFRSGIGGPIGSGKQWVSWIHLEDLARLVVRAIEDETLSGPINAVSPEPVTNEIFSQALAGVFGKKAKLHVPESVLKLTMGESSEAVLSSARVLPEKMNAAKFAYAYPVLRDALAHLAGEFPSAELVELDQWVSQKPADVFPFFSRAENLEAITPPWLNFRILQKSTAEMQAGTLIDYELKLHGLPLHWRTLIEKWEPDTGFVDIQLKGPYSLWHHTHRFIPLAGGTLIRDRVQYQLPMGTPGRLIAGSWVKQDVRKIFAYRKQAVKKHFSR